MIVCDSGEYLFIGDFVKIRDDGEVYYKKFALEVFIVICRTIEVYYK